MFGLSDNSNKTTSDAGSVMDNGMSMSTAPPAAANLNPEPDVSVMPAASMPAPTPPPRPEIAATPPPTAPPASAVTDTTSSSMPSGDLGNVSLDNAYIPSDPPTPSMPSTSSSATPAQPTAASLVNNSGGDELIKLKQQALQSLAPLVDHLDQTAEEKFKTTMMLIQASDNADLIPEAYDAANKITDEKVRAQALLDVVNEINYFTHHTDSEASPENPAS